MPEPILFILGCLVTAMTLTAIVLIGVSEGRDPHHSGRRIDGKRE